MRPDPLPPHPGLGTWLGLAALWLLLDQTSKAWIVAHYPLYHSQSVTGFFNLVRVHNPGAAFSFLADAGGWQRWFFSALGLVATVLIVGLLRQHRQQRLFATALSCILGGALGNVIDRFVHGHVIDMLDIHGAWFKPFFAGGHFPAFNVADIGISVGAILLLLDEARRVRHRRP